MGRGLFFGQSHDDDQAAAAGLFGAAGTPNSASKANLPSSFHVHDLDKATVTMAEAIAFGASVLAFIEIASKLALACQFYIGTARGETPKDLKLIFLEASSLKATLETVDFLLSASDNRLAEEETLAKQIGQSVDACKACVVDLLALIPQNVVTRDNEPRHSTAVVRDICSISAKAFVLSLGHAREQTPWR